MKDDVNRNREGNRRRVAASKARHKAGRGCCTIEYDADMLDAAVRAGYLGHFETDAKVIGAALTKLLREKSGNALACKRCGHRILSG